MRRPLRIMILDAILASGQTCLGVLVTNERGSFPVSRTRLRDIHRRYADVHAHRRWTRICRRSLLTEVSLAPSGTMRSGFASFLDSRFGSFVLVLLIRRSGRVMRRAPKETEGLCTCMQPDQSQQRTVASLGSRTVADNVASDCCSRTRAIPPSLRSNRRRPRLVAELEVVEWLKSVKRPVFLLSESFIFIPALTPPPS